MTETGRVGKSPIMHARAKRKRSRSTVLASKTEDSLACLRGDVNGGAEKKSTHQIITTFF
jgi:hypothetical protein